MKKFASCYCRYSSDKQQQQSIDFQLGEIKKFCNKHNIELVAEYIDEAQSGSSDNRVNFRRMINDAKLSNWDFIIVYDFSRLARNVEDQMYYQKVLKEQGILIKSVNEQFDDTPEGHLFNLITAGMNEYYLKNLSRRSFAGVMQNARKGKVVGGYAPFGYKVVNKEYVIDEHEAKAVRFIFEKTYEGWSYQSIADELNKKGYKTRQGKPFTNNMYNTLTNVKYKGTFIFNQTKRIKDKGKFKNILKDPTELVIIENGITAIINERLFRDVKKILSKRKKHYKKELHGLNYLLTGFTICEKCGYSYTGSSSYKKNSVRPYYEYRHSRNNKLCKQKSIKAKYLNDWYIDEVIPELLKIANIRKNRDKLNEQIIERIDKLKHKDKKLRETIKKVDNEIKEKFESIDTTFSHYLMMEEIEKLKIQLFNEQKKLKDINRDIKRLKRLSLEDLRKYIRKIKSNFNEAKNRSQYDKVNRNIISKITISNERIKLFLNYKNIGKEYVDYEMLFATINRENLLNRGRINDLRDKMTIK